MTTAKRGRKRTGYFYEEQEQAVRDFNLTTDQAERDRIFNTILEPAFKKMVESIIRRYKLYVPDEEFDDTFHDVLSFLMSKIHKFKPEKNKKAYSYCGTICKNYLYHKLNQFKKHQEKQESYDEISDSIKEDGKYSEFDYPEDSKELFLNDLINGICNKIQAIIDDDRISLNSDEVRVGQAIIYVFKNWETEFEEDLASNKMNKSAILLAIKEMTQLDTVSIRKNMRKYKIAYLDLKKMLLES